MSDGITVTVTGDDIEAARLLAVRAALRLETLGLQRRGRSARVLANEAMGTGYRTAKAAYPKFDEWLVTRYPGRVSPRPLKETA
jgi:hypothetical protein